MCSSVLSGVSCILKLSGKVPSPVKSPASGSGDDPSTASTMASAWRDWMAGRPKRFSCRSLTT